MCGITGFVGFSSDALVSAEQICFSTDRLRHRGPDDHGALLLDPVTGKFSEFKTPENAGEIRSARLALGHRRLSILDLSPKGHQPMSADDGRIWTVFNGEIYNFIELRNELCKLGHVFHTDCDTEVLLHAYLEWETDCFARFNGMWAVALYDTRTDRLILSRDRFGKKPLYYYRNGDFLIFGSEIKSIMVDKRVPCEPNLRKVADYAGRNYRYVDDNEDSFFKNICQVPKSSFVSITLNGDSRTEVYWRLEPGDESASSQDQNELVERFRDLLADAVRIRLRSDVPVGSMLSGGMDSTSITCLAAKSNPDFTSFSSVTGDGYYDETEYINEIIKHTGIKSNFVYPKPDDLIETLREMLTFHDEPICTVTWYSLYLATKEIAKYDIPVILTGHGGDELLGGYWDHYHYNFADIRQAGQDDSAEHQAWLDNHKRSPEEYDKNCQYLALLQNNTSVEPAKFSQYLHALSGDCRSHVREIHPDSPYPHFLSRRLWLEMMRETVPATLRAEDRNMMSHAIETRVPFLDHRLAEFCFSLGNQYKIRNGLGKWILREAMRGILPEKVRTRKDKTGHNAPLSEWLRTTLKTTMEEIINSNNRINLEIYDRSEVKKLYREHLSGANHYMFFFQYMNLYLWFENIKAFKS